MIGAFKRLFKVAEAEAHSAIDSLEEPIKMTEQGIRDLRKDLEVSMKNLAEVKAVSIRMTKEQSRQKQVAADYERKAMLLLGKAQKGELDASEADRLASQALAKKETAMQQATSGAQTLSNQEAMVSQLEGNVSKLKQQIDQWENELKTLRARAKVAASTKKLNKQLAQVDSDSTIAMLEKMQDKVAEDEALAQSYGEMALVETNVDMEINKALEGSGAIAGQDSLAELKAKMGLSAPESGSAS